jgi:hypothetical protein
VSELARVWGEPGISVQPAGRVIVALSVSATTKRTRKSPFCTPAGTFTTRFVFALDCPVAEERKAIAIA